MHVIINKTRIYQYPNFELKYQMFLENYLLYHYILLFICDYINIII